ncbi:MAG: tyrosine-type recombinase/integrase [Betaproteobacteria bacterium]|nr:tyrosine-type recombinase/integrase [Betaproteobacteria bacterium]
MATLNKLTAAAVKTAKAPRDRDLWVNDGGGLWLHVRPSGGKAWRLRYTVAGKRRILDIGDALVKSLADARVDAAKYRELIDRGVDPIEHDKLNRIAAREAEERRHIEEANKLTFSAAVDRWARAQLHGRKDSGREALRGLQKDVLNTLGGLELPQLRKGDLVACLDGIVARGSRRQANVTLRELKQFFSWAEAREWIARSPLAGVDKAHVGGPEAERDRVLSPDEIVLLRDQLPAANLERRTTLAIWIMLSTLCRVGELARARWDAVDLEAGTWNIPADDSKNGLPHVVFLSSFTCRQFTELRTITGWSQWVFPAPALKDRPIRRESITKQIRDRQNDLAHSHRSKARHTLRLPGGNWTPHDLRRTGATLMGENGVLSEIIERCLNHKEHRKVVRTYQRQELVAERRQAWQILGEYLDELVCGNPRKVVQLVRGAA